MYASDARNQVEKFERAFRNFEWHLSFFLLFFFQHLYYCESSNVRKREYSFDF